MKRVTALDRLPGHLLERLRGLPPRAKDLLVVAVVGLFTAPDAAVNDPGHRQDDAAGSAPHCWTR